MDDLVATLAEMSATIKAQVDSQEIMVHSLDTLTRISVATSRLCCTFAQTLGANGQLSQDAAEQCADALSEMANALQEQFGPDRLPPGLAVRFHAAARSLRD